MRPQPESSTQEVLAGLVERVTYHNAENGFCVLRAKARGHRDVVTVVGHAATIAAGEWITASGEWIIGPAHKVTLDLGQGTMTTRVVSDKYSEQRSLWARIPRLQAGSGSLNFPSHTTNCCTGWTLSHRKLGSSRSWRRRNGPDLPRLLPNPLELRLRLVE